MENEETDFVWRITTLIAQTAPKSYVRMFDSQSVVIWIQAMLEHPLTTKSSVVARVNKPKKCETQTD